MRGVQHAGRGQGADRAMAGALQHRTPLQLAGLAAASARDRPVEDARARASVGSGWISPGARHHAQLGFHLDHPVGAGQPPACRSDPSHPVWARSDDLGLVSPERGLNLTQCGFGAHYSLTDCGPEMPMISRPSADDFRSLHLQGRAILNALRDALTVPAPATPG